MMLSNGTEDSYLQNMYSTSCTQDWRNLQATTNILMKLSAQGIHASFSLEYFDETTIVIVSPYVHCDTKREMSSN